MHDIVKAEAMPAGTQPTTHPVSEFLCSMNSPPKLSWYSFYPNSDNMGLRSSVMNNIEASAHVRA